MPKPVPALHREGDSAELTIMIETLEREGYIVKRPTLYQIKVADMNFYWTTGKITIDPATVHPLKGFQAFLDLIEERGRPLYTITL